MARIELAPAEMARAMAPSLREEFVRSVTEVGFRYAALDLRGYRRGSLNEGLVQIERLDIPGQGGSGT